MSVTLSAAVAQRAGVLPDVWFDSDEAGGYWVAGPWLSRREGWGDDVVIALTPDTLSAVCRALAAKLGHTSGQVYQLVHGYPGWILQGLDDDGDPDPYVRWFKDCDALSPAAACLAIVEQLAGDA